MSLLSYLYSQLSARQWWVFVFIGSADTLYLEKGANTAQLSKIEEWVIFYNWATHIGYRFKQTLILDNSRTFDRQNIISCNNSDLYLYEHYYQHFAQTAPIS